MKAWFLTYIIGNIRNFHADFITKNIFIEKEQR